MTEVELFHYLLKHYPKENEKCEWKAFGNLKNLVSGAAGEDVISYASALSNMEGGCLILGVEDKSLNVIGIHDFHNYTPENLPNRILGNCTFLVSEGLWVESITASDSKKTVWIIHIPKHSPRQPVIAHKKAWQRSGDSLIEMTQSRKDAILCEPIFKNDDWSSAICYNSSLSDLDPQAISKARSHYRLKNPRLADELNSWDDTTFLMKSKIMVNGNLTRTAIILLGKPESTVLLGNCSPKITWVLYDKDKIEKDYGHFFPPYIVSMDEVYARIRNLKFRYLKEDSLFPEEVDQYDAQNIREALSNCISHMDYSRNGRITISEREDGYLTFTNPGTFLPGSIENVIISEEPPSYNRNSLLSEAMVSFNMIDSIGSGIKRMFKVQSERFFPMPDYDLSDQNVSVTLIGKVIDMDYARVLAKHPALTLSEITMLDKVQKKKALNEDEVRYLKGKGLIEGRKPNFYISAQTAALTKQKTDYIKIRGFKDDHYKNMVLEYIDKYGSASKEDIFDLVYDLLPKILDEKQKDNKIKNLIYAMSKRDRTIINHGNNRMSKWIRNA